MKDEVVHYEEIRQGLRDDHNESESPEVRSHQDVQDSSTNADDLGKYNEYINVI